MTLIIQRPNDRIVVYPPDAMQVKTTAGVAGVNWGLWFDHFWQAKGAASYAASLLDLVGATNLVEGNGAIPWAAGTGWAFVVAAAQWLDTNLTPATDQSWSMMVQYAGAGNTAYLCGQVGNIGLDTWFTLETRNGYGNGARLVVAPFLATGNLAVAGDQGYRNGIADGGAIGAWSHAVAVDVYIGCRNTAGVAQVFTNADICAVGIKKGPALTAPQVAAAALAMSLL